MFSSPVTINKHIWIQLVKWINFGFRKQVYFGFTSPKPTYLSDHQQADTHQARQPRDRLGLAKLYWTREASPFSDQICPLSETYYSVFIDKNKMNISSNGFCSGPCCISKDLRNRSIKFCYIQGTCAHDNHSDGEDCDETYDYATDITKMRSPFEIVRTPTRKSTEIDHLLTFNFSGWGKL